MAAGLVLGAGLCQAARAEVRLPNLFGSRMVVQQEKPLAVWGWAQPNENITVEIGNESRKAQANERGEWKVELPAMKAGGPHALTISGSSVVRFEDVMVGEVWLCSGQSNMEMGIGAVRDGSKEIAAANYPAIRLLMITNRWTPEPRTDVEGTWQVCSPETVAAGGWGGFSAAAYFFGRELHQKLNVAVGLIDASWGGTRIEPWTPPEGFAAVPALKEEYQRLQFGDPRTPAHQKRLQEVLQDTEGWLAAAKQALAQHTNPPPMPTYPEELLPPHQLQHRTALYNGMIHPLRRFALRGAIWYQGESNVGEGMLYAERMKALVGGWREVWGDNDLAFYFVQIAPYTYQGKSAAVAELWEAQAAAQAIPNSGMVVINDIGDLKDIHPANKQEVGRRLALWALAKTYGQRDLVHTGPSFKAMNIEGDKIRLTFDNVGGGLASRDGKPLTWFEIIDAEEGGFVKADAQIDGSTVVLSAPEAKHPAAMRFAWDMLAEPNLMNAGGLPAGPFRAGTIPRRDLMALKVPEAKEYQLVYDLDLAGLGPTINYRVDNHARLERPFDRIAYCLELQQADGMADYVYVSMDAFTSALDKVGVPTIQSGARFQRNVSNLNVYSNVKGIITGTGLAGGNIEFWPDNYGGANGAKVPNASGQVYDFGDEPSAPADGYGSMQIHNHDAKQVLLALNHWREGTRADAGIGNQPTGNPDWTFAGNAGSYQSVRLRVLVRCK